MKKQFDDNMKQHGIMGFAYFTVKQPPLQIKSIRLIQAETFTDEVMYYGFIQVMFSNVYGTF